MNKKFWILIQETDEHGHHAAYISPVTSSDNIASICKALPSSAAANIYPTKKAADNIARLLNDDWHRRGVYKWDFMEDGTTPAPF